MAGVSSRPADIELRSALRRLLADGLRAARFEVLEV